MGTKAATLLCALATTAFLASANGASAASAGVTMQNVRFTPDDLTISPGDTVTWTHMDGSTPHTVTAQDGSFNSSPNCDRNTGIGCMTGGATFSHTFGQTGTFAYACKVHPNMTGVVRVAGAPPPPPTQPAPGPTPTTAPAARATTTSRPTTTTSTSTTTTLAPSAAADAGSTSSTTAAAGGGVALPAKKTSTGGGGLNGGVVALAAILAAGAAAGGVLLRRRLSSS